MQKVIGNFKLPTNEIVNYYDFKDNRPFGSQVMIYNCDLIKVEKLGIIFRGVDYSWININTEWIAKDEVNNRPLIEEIKEWMATYTTLHYCGNEHEEYQFWSTSTIIYVKPRINCRIIVTQKAPRDIVAEFKFHDLKSFIEGYGTIPEMIKLELVKETARIMTTLNTTLFITPPPDNN